MKRMLSIFICLLFLALPASAEDAAADLQARFGGEAGITHGGVKYTPRKRISTLLFAAHEDDALLFAYIMAVDDDLDRIALFSLPPETTVPGPEGKTLAQVFADPPTPADGSGSDSLSPAEQGSIALLDAVNALFPEALIESRLALDIAGLDLLDGGIEADPALSRAAQTKARLKDIYHAAEGLSSSDQMDVFDTLSAYLATDVKTGAMMKIADKAQRYEILPTMPLPGNALPAMQDGESGPFIPDEAALLALAIEYFYEESPW